MKVFMAPFSKNPTRDRKISVRIDKYDTWSMDHSLAYIILPMLNQLKATKHGAPNTDDKDVPKRLRSTSAPRKAHKYDTDKNHFKRWNWILDEMIWTFDQYNKDWERQFHTGKSDTLWQAVDKNNKRIGKPKKLQDRTKLEGVFGYIMVKGPKDTHKFNKKGYEKHWNRMQNGLRLFGTYYTGLWD